MKQKVLKLHTNGACCFCKEFPSLDDENLKRGDEEYYQSGHHSFFLLTSYLKMDIKNKVLESSSSTTANSNWTWDLNGSLCIKCWKVLRIFSNLLQKLKQIYQELRERVFAPLHETILGADNDAERNEAFLEAMESCPLSVPSSPLVKRLRSEILNNCSEVLIKLQEMEENLIPTREEKNSHHDSNNGSLDINSVQNPLAGEGEDVKYFDLLQIQSNLQQQQHHQRLQVNRENVTLPSPSMLENQQQEGTILISTPDNLQSSNSALNIVETEMQSVNENYVEEVMDEDDAADDNNPGGTMEQEISLNLPPPEQSINRNPQKKQQIIPQKRFSEGNGIQTLPLRRMRESTTAQRDLVPVKRFKCENGGFPFRNESAIGVINQHNSPRFPGLQGQPILSTRMNETARSQLNGNQSEMTETGNHSHPSTIETVRVPAATATNMGVEIGLTGNRQIAEAEQASTSSSSSSSSLLPQPRPIGRSSASSEAEVAEDLPPPPPMSLAGILQLPDYSRRCIVLVEDNGNSGEEEEEEENLQQQQNPNKTPTQNNNGSPENEVEQDEQNQDNTEEEGTTAAPVPVVEYNLPPAPAAVGVVVHPRRFNNEVWINNLGMYQCTKCTFISHTARGVTHHFSMKHIPAEDKLLCRLCSKWFKNLNCLRSHYSVYHNTERTRQQQQFI